MINDLEIEKTGELLFHQLGNLWIDIDKNSIKEAIPFALKEVKESFEHVVGRRFMNEKEEPVFNSLCSIHWMIFLYRLSNKLFKMGAGNSADQVYYLNKIMHSNDWFYAIELPRHFLCEHPLGSVLGRATYGDYLFVYQGTTVGGNRSKGELFYPQIGRNVILFANASILGKSTIGNNVVVSAGTQIINDTVPDNCIVFGRSPDLVVCQKTESEIKTYTEHIWRWDVL